MRDFQTRTLVGREQTGHHVVQLRESHGAKVCPLPVEGGKAPVGVAVEHVQPIVVHRQEPWSCKRDGCRAGRLSGRAQEQQPAVDRIEHRDTSVGRYGQRLRTSGQTFTWFHEADLTGIASPGQGRPSRSPLAGRPVTVRGHDFMAAVVSLRRRLLQVRTVTRPPPPRRPSPRAGLLPGRTRASRARTPRAHTGLRRRPTLSALPGAGACAGLSTVPVADEAMVFPAGGRREWRCHWEGRRPSDERRHRDGASGLFGPWSPPLLRVTSWSEAK